MSKLLTIREAQPADAAQIAQVNFETWRSTYSGILDPEFLEARSLEEQVSLWQETLNTLSPSSKRFVAVSGRDVVGYSGGGRNPDTRSPFQSELFGIYVLKAYQGQGLGQELTKVLARWLIGQNYQSMQVWIMEKNPYRRFYEKLGADLLDQSRDLDYGGKRLTVVSYGWLNLPSLTNL